MADHGPGGRTTTAPFTPEERAHYALVVFIATNDGMAERLLTKHTDDGSGHCASCTSGGQTGHYVWPCAIAGAATAARS